MLNAGQYPEAVAVYEQDQKWLPKNGWALSGLFQAYRATGNTTWAQQTKQALGVAWHRADTKLVASVVP